MDYDKSYQAILTDLKAPYLEDVEHDELDKDEVLIKVLAAVVNPSDTMFAIGKYGIPSRMNEPPLGVGAEGAGVIVDVSSLYCNIYRLTSQLKILSERLFLSVKMFIVMHIWVLGDNIPFRIRILLFHILKELMLRQFVQHL
jgi:hypothetical protein